MIDVDNTSPVTGTCADCEQPRTDLRSGICPDCWHEYDVERARNEMRGE